MKADDIVRRAWQELPREDRNLLEAIGADQWQVCDRELGTYANELLHSAGHEPLPAGVVSSRNAAVALWIPGLRVVLINESHSALGDLDGRSFEYGLTRIAWHEWGHALSLDRAAHADIAAGERYVGLLRADLARFVREAGYRPQEYTHEVVAEIYSMLMGRRRLGKTGRPPWLHAEVYELVRRVAGWNR